VGKGENFRKKKKGVSKKGLMEALSPPPDERIEGNAFQRVEKGRGQEGPLPRRSEWSSAQGKKLWRKREFLEDRARHLSSRP